MSHAGHIEHEREQYEAFLARFEKMKKQIKELSDDAAKAGDQETVWFCKAQLADLERSEKSLRKPGEPRR